MSAIVALAFLGFAILGVPIAFALGLAALTGLLIADLPLNMLAEKMFFSVDSFPLMAIPFFMLAGDLMVHGGIIRQLVAVANSFVGHVRGGLAHTSVLAGAGLACVSGTAVADAAALSSAMNRSMSKIYSVPFSSAVIAAAANLGPILPPSTAMIIYATLAGGTVTIPALFAAGVIPGLLIAGGMMAIISLVARRRGYAVTGERFSLARALRELSRSFVVLLMPVIVIGGIMGGAFTPTEGGAIAVLYAFLAGMFVTRELKLSMLPGALLRAVVTTAVVGALIAFASTVTFLFTVDMLPVQLNELISSLTSDRTMFLLIIMAVMMVVGMFIEPASAYVMFVPILAPLAVTFGVDPLHFAMVFILTLIVGMLTPPVGTLLFVMCGINRISLWDLSKEILPFVVLQQGLVIIIIFFPALILWLPRALGL
jgi:tripartite ATP-independent transporter DctM subunit